MKKWVISLGGSQLVPNKVNTKFLKQFKEIIDSHPSQKFVIVTGGGSTARKYINALRKLGKSTKTQSESGIAITRFHASFLTKIFGKKANEELPKNMKKVKNLLNKNQVVFCGALRYKPKNTSDGNAADLASYLKCPFINITNVQGLYTANPKTNKKARRIPKITWKKFYQKAKKIKYKAGQHFVLDQNAAKTIMQDKVPTYIIGELEQLERIIKNKKFTGTLIKG